MAVRLTSDGALAALFVLLAIAAGIAQAVLVTLEAESAVAGAEWSQAADGGMICLSPTTTTAGESPGSSARVLTFTVTFLEPGTYNLFGRVRVGPEGGNDDSLFWANGSGTKSPTERGLVIEGDKLEEFALAG